MLWYYSNQLTEFRRLVNELWCGVYHRNRATGLLLLLALRLVCIEVDAGSLNRLTRKIDSRSLNPLLLWGGQADFRSSLRNLISLLMELMKLLVELVLVQNVGNIDRLDNLTHLRFQLHGFCCNLKLELELFCLH